MLLRLHAVLLFVTIVPVDAFFFRFFFCRFLGLFCPPAEEDSSPSTYPSEIPSDLPRSSPSAAPTPAPLSLQEEIIKDMMPNVSSLCVRRPITSSFNFESSQNTSQWWEGVSDYEEYLFLAKMVHTDTEDPNQEWTIRLGQAGNIYSFVGPMGETVPPQLHGEAPWVDEVWQAVTPLGPGGDNDNDPTTGKYFIHEAGTYQKDNEYEEAGIGIPLKKIPFYSPTVGSYCEDESGECAFVSWGQQAHVPTPWESPVLYFNRYVNCGNGVMEHTNLRHSNVGNEDNYDYLNVPWGGTRHTVLADIVLTNKATGGYDLLHPLPEWGSSGTNRKLADTLGYTVFAEDLPGDLHGTPFDLPENLNWEISGNCVESLFHTNRDGKLTMHCPLVPTTDLGATGEYATRLLFETDNNGCEIAASGILHYAYEGSKFYFYPEADVTAVQACFTVGTNITNVTYYDPGIPQNENRALAHVHGQGKTGGEYPRVRFGGTSRNYNVYTINALTTITGGDSYYYRQYFIMDNFTEMATKGAMWSPEATDDKFEADDAAGRKVELYYDNNSTFGASIGDDDYCVAPSSKSACVGSTTPKSNFKILYQVRCSTSVVVTDDPYYFAPAGTPRRPYVCDGQPQERPQWLLLGFFNATDCGAIATGFHYEQSFC